MYQPTLFVPLDIIDNMNEVINPIETAIKTLASQAALNPSIKPLIKHNLHKLQEFRQAQHTITDNYLDACALRSKAQ